MKLKITDVRHHPGDSAFLIDDGTPVFPGAQKP